MIDGLHLDMQLFEPEIDTSIYWVVLCRLWLQMLTRVSDSSGSNLGFSGFTSVQW